MNHKLKLLIRLTNSQLVISKLLIIFLFSLSVFTIKAQNRAQYMGWHSTYAQMYRGLGSNITEDFLKNQTDWMSKNFLKYGYNFVCLDGWVGDATRHNADGYITSFSYKWKGGWKEMADYVHSKGMKFGMYYSPGWAYRPMADNTNNKIKGTDITIKSITDPNSTFESWYQINTDKPGAEQYVKGMVQYFISQGIDLLKVDFLREYENSNGHDRYVKLIRWINEAAENKIIIVLCLPIGMNHLQDERRYGHAVRVVGDYNKEGWGHTSSINQFTSRDNAWPLADNVFDGLIASSDITGTGTDKCIASPDFYTFHDTATLDEKKTAITLRIIAGAAVEFGDSYIDIGGNENANYLRNSELTSLNLQGFMGKPLSRTLTDIRSQIWKGVDKQGNHVVALFNRGNNAETRSVNFKNDLGLTGNYIVRDLWKHQNSATALSTFSTSVPAHGVVIIQIYVGNSPPPNGDANPPGQLIANVVPNLSQNSYYSIINVNSNKCLTVSEASNNEGASIVQWTYNNGDNDKWRISPLTDGYYKITNKKSGKAFSVNGESIQDDATIIQSGLDGLNSDKWQLADIGDKTFILINKKSGKVIDIPSGSLEDGPKIVQYSSSGATNQLFRLNEVEKILTLSTNETNQLVEDLFKIYPNPSNNLLTVSISKYKVKDKIRIEIYSISGSVVKTYILENEITNIDVSNLPVGIYFLKANEINRKIIINR
jgi:hypothetical protein